MEKGRWIDLRGACGMVLFMNDDAVTSAEKQETKRVIGRPFPAGVSGNPAGRPKGSTSLKVFAREYLLTLTDEEKRARLAKLEDEDFIALWRMAEGNPHSTEDVRHTVNPTPIMKLEDVKVDIKVIDTPNSETPTASGVTPTA